MVEFCKSGFLGISEPYDKIMADPGSKSKIDFAWKRCKFCIPYGAYENSQMTDLGVMFSDSGVELTSTSEHWAWIIFFSLIFSINAIQNFLDSFISFNVNSSTSRVHYLKGTKKKNKYRTIQK